MKLHQRTQRHRLAFTLIELLVVIAIIAILIGLTAAGVFQYLAKIPQTQTMNDLQQFGNAMQNFKQRFTRYPPDRIYLGNRYSDYSAQPGDSAYQIALRQQSLQYLGQMFPKLNWSSGIDWTGNGNTNSLPVGGIMLDNDQCLVYFLGGLQINGGCVGFSTNGQNPTQTGGARLGPYFEFQTSRLFVRPGTSTFFAYQDNFSKQQSYVYFSAYSNAGQATTSSTANNYTTVASQGVLPYYTAAATANSATQYVNSTTYQVISAGADGQFGPGGFISASGGLAQGTPGFDDWANFSSVKLGVGIQ
jgi:prepilin-type N-terminal cleavage/methylation domain-containing protein